ncbi:MAG: histidinol-phosphate transaminase [Candidatus Acidiferrales bacterium]
MPLHLSRRHFAKTVGATLGAALVAEHLTLELAEARLPRGFSDNAILLNSNENPYGPSKRAIKAMKNSLESCARYPDALISEMRDAVARLHRVSPEQVALGCGSGDILRVAAGAFLGHGREIVLAEPTYEEMWRYAQNVGAVQKKIAATSDYRHDLPAMADACSSNTGLIYICNPCNPTGTIVYRDELAAFLDRTPPTAAIIIDEAYHHFAEDPRYASAFDLLNRAPNLVVARTFSKIYGMAGMRLGYAVASPELIARMGRFGLWNPLNAAVLEAGLASLEDADHVAKQRKLNNETRDWLCRELQRDGRRCIPSHTNFIMLDVGRDVVEVAAEFRQREILVGRKFPPMNNWLRVSIGTRKEMEKFLAALRQIVPTTPVATASATSASTATAARIAAETAKAA